MPIRFGYPSERYAGRLFPADWTVLQENSEGNFRPEQLEFISVHEAGETQILWDEFSRRAVKEKATFAFHQGAVFMDDQSKFPIDLRDKEIYWTGTWFGSDRGEIFVLYFAYNPEKERWVVRNHLIGREGWVTAGIFSSNAVVPRIKRR